jgi:hypothetical protein
VSAALIGCFSYPCTREFKTFLEMAQHRSIEHKVPVA